MKLHKTILATSTAAMVAAAMAASTLQAEQQEAVTCFFKEATIVGTAGGDTIQGTPNADVIASLGGNDVVEGLAGNDTIRPGAGRDVVKGGAGDDQFVSEATLDGSDVLIGNTGRDRVSYLLRKSSVDVSIDGIADDGAPEEGDNVRISVEDVTGSQVADAIVGSDAPNALFGGNGNDDLRGGLGNDSLSGGNDKDLLIGNAGDDFGFGNNGGDTWFAAAVADGADFFEGGTGFDTATYEARAAALQVTLDNVPNDGATGEGDNIRLDVEGVTGGGGNDTIRANLFQENPNLLRGGFGSDILSSIDSPFVMNDVVDGGASNDLCLTDDDDNRFSCEF